MKAFIPIVLAALLLVGCVNPPHPPPPVAQPKPAPTVISRTVTSHPPAYRNKGRPAWTYDENRFHEDIQGEVNLVEELREPDKYHFFLGAQTVFVGTEENARSGAQIDAINNFKAFLQTTGRNYLQERRGAGLGQQDIREFQSRMDAAATAESRQLKIVRWYFEEEKTEWSDGRIETRWRAWGLAAFDRARANDLYERMLEREFRPDATAGDSLPPGTDDLLSYPELVLGFMELGGTMRTANDRRQAIVTDRRTGQQRIIKDGDTFGVLHVIRVTDRSVLFRHDDGRHFYLEIGKRMREQ